MSNNIDDFVLCDDERGLRDAIAAIKLCSHVIFDCEGQDLGQDGGSLSLISFRTTKPEIPKTYLIDVLSFTDDTLKPVFDIIRSPSPTKIVFDGRMDYAELFHGHGISIRGVLDLQLADICSRRLRGKYQEDQWRRLSPYLKRGEVKGNPGCYTQVQRLCSLEQCLREHEEDMYIGIQGHSLVDRLLTRPSVNHNLWLKRRLPEEYLRYAVWDVYFIGSLFDHFKDMNYITDPLSAQSERYVAIWQDARPKKTDEYRNHALLPLHILDDNDYAPVRACICCQRGLPKPAYSIHAWGKPKQRRCWVCRAIYLKVKVHRDVHSFDGSDDYEDAILYGGYHSWMSRRDYDDYDDGMSDSGRRSD